MDTITETLSQKLEWRYATKHFDSSERISEQNWEFLKKVLVLSPSSYGLQPWKIVLVQNQELRKLLRAASFNQAQIEECSHLVVFTALKKVTESYIKRYLQRFSEVRSVPLESLKGYEGMMIGDLVNGPRAAMSGSWAQRQAYIAMGFLLEAAALASIDACPMEGFDPSKYDEILGLSGSEYASVAVVALGYRSPEDAHQQYKKVRLEPAELIVER